MLPLPHIITGTKSRQGVYLQMYIVPEIGKIKDSKFPLSYNNALKTTF